MRRSSASPWPKGPADQRAAAAPDRRGGVPALAREMIGVLAGQLDGLDIKLRTIEKRLMAWHRQDQTSQCLATIPGIGPIAGVSFALKVADPQAFRSSRHFASWIGITPRENSTAGDRSSAGSAAPAMRIYGACWSSGRPR